jgi:hypothetical protein
LSKHIKIPDSASVGKFLFSQTIIDLGLFKHNDIKELFNYINNKDVELIKVKILVKKANIKLRIYDKKLFIRKSSIEKVKNLICVTRR